MKPGRNDSCPCGSGKKYKDCCLTDANSKQESAFQTRRALEREVEIVEDMIAFAETAFGGDAMARAWIDFNAVESEDDVDGVEDEDPINDVFLPWYVFNWLPAGKQTVAEAYLAANAGTLTDADKGMLAAVGRRPLSFFEITKKSADGWVELRDLLLGVDAAVFDESIAAEGTVGDLMFGAVRPAHGVAAATFTSAPFFLDHEMGDDVEMLKAALLKETGETAVSAAALETFQTDVIGFFLDSFGEGETDD